VVLCLIGNSSHNMAVEGNFPGDVAEDEPVYLTVRKTFFEMVSPTAAPLVTRRRSEPLSFKPEDLSPTCTKPDPSSESSTDVSEEEASPTDAVQDEHEISLVGQSDCTRRNLLLPIASRRSGESHGYGILEQPPPAEHVGSSAEVDGDADDEGGMEGMRTPSTWGQRTPDCTVRSAKRVSFASLGDLRPMDDHQFGSAGCLRKSSFTDRSPATPAKKVSFSTQDDVLPIPADEDASSHGEECPSRVRLSSSAKPWMPASIAASPSAWVPPAGISPESSARASYAVVVESARVALAACGQAVSWTEAKEGPRGWTVIAYVDSRLLAYFRDYLLAVAQQALFAATDASEKVFLLGYAACPFTPMSFGFGTALAHMPDKRQACWSSFSKGFCDNPSCCLREHPKCQVGVNVMLKPTRVNR